MPESDTAKAIKGCVFAHFSKNHLNLHPCGISVGSKREDVSVSSPKMWSPGHLYNLHTMSLSPWYRSSSAIVESAVAHVISRLALLVGGQFIDRLWLWGFIEGLSPKEGPVSSQPRWTTFLSYVHDDIAGNHQVDVQYVK